MDTIQENTPLVSPPRVTNSLLGIVRSCNTITAYEWTFLGFVTINLTAVLGIVLYRLFDLPKTSSEFAFAILLIINLFFCYWHAVHGVLYEQPYEIFFLVISSAHLVVYSSMSFFTEKTIDNTGTARFYYTALMGPLIIGNGLFIGWGYYVSRNLIFRTVGGDPLMQSLCFKAQVQCVLLIFDLQAILSCLVLIIHAVDINLHEELLLFILGTIFLFAWTVLGFVTVRLESSVGFSLFLVLACTHPSFVIWRLINDDKYRADGLEKITCQVTGVTFLVVHSSLIINTIKVYRNFGKGLKEKIYGCGVVTRRYD